jgi:hypothetical protein
MLPIKTMRPFNYPTGPLGLEPRMAEPESAVLPITPRANGLAVASEDRFGKQTRLNDRFSSVLT